ncbi:unnamed protein product [Lymnaea stagnalis]|uniref:Major facilitator superfamily (MFS) profile domain-containing protein n=1 Tax=Lymnaea stagnalis TaxID=6523 RepID=A0AAV2HPW3_LYMST
MSAEIKEANKLVPDEKKEHDGKQNESQFSNDENREVSQKEESEIAEDSKDHEANGEEILKKTNHSCLQWLTLKLKLVDKGATPPNWKYIGLVFVALFSSASTLTFLFPFLPEMVLTFGYSENEKGTYAGIIASGVFAGRIVGSVFWGWLADRYGRKIVLLITIGLNGIFAGLFGFADNIILAVFLRFMCGAVNGTVGTAKTVLYDISDNTNQALSMSMLSISWGMGLIVGPTVGGLLASPAIKWPHVFDSDGFFGRYPYLLASLFPFVTCTLIFFVIYFKFDETFIVKSSKRENQELLITDATENKPYLSVNSVDKSHLPFLGGASQEGTSSLLLIAQSLQSVHLDTESSAFLGMEVIKKQPISLQESEIIRTISVSDIMAASQKQSLDSISSSSSEKLSQSALNENLLKSVSSKEIIYVTTEQRAKETEIENFEENESQMTSSQNGRNEQSDHSYNEKLNLKNSYKIVYSQPGLVCDTEKVNIESLASEGDKLLISKNEYVDCAARQVDFRVKPEDEEEDICSCVELACLSSCCTPCRNTSIHKLLRLTDVWATIMMYTVFSFTTIAVEDIFPVFASTTHDYGGLGFSTDEIGLAIGAMVLPLLVLQIKLYPYMVSKMGIRKVFLVSAIVSLITCQILPTVRLLHNNRVWLWICLIGFQIPFKIATNCCFAGTSLLINNSVTQELAGQVNGLAMMTTAIGRTFAPLVSGVLFSWSVTYGIEIGAPFDTSFPFFVIGLLFFVTVFECLHLNPELDQQKKRG